MQEPTKDVQDKERASKALQESIFSKDVQR
jgi:hypothetical protein